jgi:hypothetical protein
MTRFHPYYTRSVSPISPSSPSFTSPLPPAPSSTISPDTSCFVTPLKRTLPQIEDLPIAALKKQKILKYSTTNSGLYGMELAAAALSLTPLKYAVSTGSSMPISLGQEMAPGVSVGFIPPSVIVPQYVANFPAVNTGHSPQEAFSSGVDLNTIPLPTRSFFRALRGTRSSNTTAYDKDDDVEPDDQIIMQAEEKGEDQDGLPPHP